MFLDNIKTKTILKTNNIGKNRFKKLLKVQKFWLSNLTLTELNEGNKNSLKLDMSYSKELEQKIKMLQKLILQRIWITLQQKNENVG